jgi:hypothetical protein
VRYLWPTHQAGLHLWSLRPNKLIYKEYIKCSLFFWRFSVNYMIVNLLLFSEFPDCCFK